MTIVVRAPTLNHHHRSHSEPGAIDGAADLGGVSTDPAEGRPARVCQRTAARARVHQQRPHPQQ